MKKANLHPVDVIAAICTAGRSKLLERAIASVLAQKRLPTKLIICFDLDASIQAHRPSILDLKQGCECDVEVIQNNRPQGLAGSANTIVDYLRQNLALNPSTIYLSFLDDDDYWPENYLSECLPALQAGKDVTASVIKRIEKSDKIIKQVPPQSLVPEDFLVGGSAIQLSNLIVWLSAIEAIGGFDEELITNHDRDLCIRLTEGQFNYKAILDTAVFHDTSHGDLRMSSPHNPLKQEGIRRFYRKWAPAMSDSVLQRSLERSAQLFNYNSDCNRDFTPGELPIGTMSISKRRLERFLDQFENIHLTRFRCQIIAFANYPESQNRVFETNFGSIQIIAMPKLKKAEPISIARNILHYNILKFCHDKAYNPLIWLLDDDTIIPQETVARLPHCWALKTSKRYDILIGSIEGESPNSALFGLRGELSDFKRNLDWINSINNDDKLPHRSHLGIVPN